MCFLDANRSGLFIQSELELLERRRRIRVSNVPLFRALSNVSRISYGKNDIKNFNNNVIQRIKRTSISSSLKNFEFNLVRSIRIIDLCDRFLMLINNPFLTLVDRSMIYMVVT